MARPAPGQEWVDRYVRGELSMNEIVDFENALMDSPGLQEELETALCLRELIRVDTAGGAPAAPAPRHPLAAGGWRPLALAASMILAVFSTLMYWKAGSESRELQQQLDRLQQPRGEVLEISLDIMRSLGPETPDAVIMKPDGRAAILLAIELAPSARRLDRIEFELKTGQGERLAAWSAAPEPDGRTRVVLDNDSIPADRVSLEMSTPDGRLLDRRLLLFLDD